MTESNLVDLATLDRDLEDIMLKHYSGKIFEKQHHVDTSDPDDRVYRFFNLEKDVLLKFLKDYDTVFEYEVSDSKNGEPIATNKINKKAHGEPRIYSEPKITTYRFFLFDGYNEKEPSSKLKLLKDLFLGSFECPFKN